MRSHRAISILLALVACSGCASVYHPAGRDGGYSDTQVGRNMFRVTVQGNVRSTQAETDEMVLLRSAEVALQHGYPFFATSSSAPTGTAMSIATSVVSVPASSVTIVGFPTRPETTVTVYESEQVMVTLGAKYYHR